MNAAPESEAHDTNFNTFREVEFQAIPARVAGVRNITGLNNSSFNTMIWDYERSQAAGAIANILPSAKKTAIGENIRSDFSVQPLSLNLKRCPRLLEPASDSSRRR